ncbi:uncharacterized protein LOC124361772 isoform X2 [Homalodisca vitripennis]|uniref:Uncharacterized protein n=1 Tax=Homalodisca liturata TaxID=320908 RepID=A0A1B6HB52_9HEMI|nr:uncharacterized protein LOC124361772 isoform X2 [Homalodisca vitripennis]KAG8298922.1 hypothetical protein J6590_002889 [Homalodisca vitripennis]
MSADILQARREARRRKILENSENRLRRITGRNEVKESLDEDGEVKNATSEVLLNGKVNYGKMDCSYFPSQAQIPAGDTLPAGILHSEQLNPSLSEMSVDEEVSSQSTTLHQPSSMFYISMAVLFRLFLEFDVLYLCGDSMVIAFLVMKCGVICVYGSFIPESSRFLGSLLLLSGISPQKIRVLTLVTSVVYSILRDFALYMFVFVFSDLLIGILKYLL